VIECSICKSRNHEDATFCAECGQRLQPAVNSPFKLHSPLLDSGGNVEATSSGQAHQPVNNKAPNLPRPAQPASNNTLHSPLLDAWENRPDAGQSSNRAFRLHSPVLDGPEQTTRSYEPEDLDLPVEEYNSLRSPILAAKVPLPDTSKPAEPSVMPPVEPPAIALPPASPPVFPTKQSTIKSLFGPSTDTQQSQEESYRQFASSLFEQSPADTAEKPAIRSARPTTGHFSKVTGIKKEENLETFPIGASLPSESKNISKNISSNISGNQSLLPRVEEFANQKLPAAESSRTGFKVTAFLFLLVAIVCKFAYLQALGMKTLTSSPTFLADQAGQVLLILVMFILILAAKP
jgi:hypothetical protein